MDDTRVGPDPQGLADKALGQLSNDEELLGWLREAAMESEAFLSSQPGWNRIPEAIDCIMSQDQGVQDFDPRKNLSRTRTNRVAKIAEDLAALLTDIKPFWEYSVANRRFEQHAAIYSKLATFWFQHRNIDLRLADALKYYIAAGTGYLHMYWNPDLGDIDVCAEDPRNVLPIRPTGYESLEACLGVIVKKKVPVNYIRDRYGVNVIAESDGSSISWLAKTRDAASDVVSPIWRFRKAGKAEPDMPRIPTVTLYTCYLKDRRRHDGSKPREMGQFVEKQEWEGEQFTTKRVPANQWSYSVAKGERLYPHGRMIVWAGSKILYDGPGLYWHEQFPLIKLTLNPYPWSWLGKAPVWDLLDLNKSLNQILRVVDDHSNQVAQPGAIMDKNNVSRSTFDTFDTRRAGWKILQNPLAGKGVQIVNPPPLDAAIWQHIKFLQEEMAELSGVTDLSRMMDLKQMPSNSTVESITNAMTPGLRARSRILEAFARQLAIQLAYNFTEFYTLPMRVAILGPGGITQDDFDFDPGSLLPDYVHSNDFNDKNEITPDALLRGPLPKYKRAQEFLRQFIFKVMPGSLLNSAQMERTLVFFQLTRMGIMDPITLLEQLGIPNIGVDKLPDNVRTVLDRLQWCMSVGLMPSVNAAGRKASGQSPPQIKVSESN